MNRSNEHKTAFTLIELLVVVAIISLLVSILLPSLQRAKILSRDVMCLSNLKSIGTWGTIYYNDYNGILPHNGGPDDSNGYYKFSGGGDDGHGYKATWWVKALEIEDPSDSSVWWPGREAEVKENFLQCPQLAVEAPRRYWRRAWYGYSLNNYLGGRLGGGPRGTPRHSDLRSTLLNAEKMWFADANVAGYYSGATTRLSSAIQINVTGDNAMTDIADDGPWCYQVQLTDDYPFIPHTNGKSQFVFGDGHADGVYLGTQVEWLEHDVERYVKFWGWKWYEE